MPTRVRRTVTIGLGGTGCAAALNMKRRLIRAYGTIPPMFKFLVLDTTEPNEMKEAGEDIKLKGSEFIKIGVQEPKTIMRVNKEVKAWLDTKMIPPRALVSLVAGAKAIRPLGRLAVFANAKDIQKALKNLIDAVRDNRLNRVAGDDFEILPNVCVNLVGSVAGGTGSGSFLDVSFIVRSMLTDKDKLNAYILLPDAFLDKPATGKVQGNTYGALKEIDYLMNKSEDDHMTYKLGGTEIEIPGGVWNLVYLVNNTKGNDEIIDDLNEITEFLGTGMFILSGNTGKEQGDIIDNLEAVVTNQPPWFDGGIRANYCCFGTSELVFPKKAAEDLVADKLALQILDKLFLGASAAKMGNDVENLIDELGIREDTADQVIERICDRSHCRKMGMSSDDFSKNAWTNLKGNKNVVIESTKQNLKEVCYESLEKLKQEKFVRLHETVEKHLNRQGGPAYTRILLESLLGRLTQFLSDMKDEQKGESQKLSSLNHKYKNVEKNVDEAYKGLFGKKKKVQTGFTEYCALVNMESTTIMEIERRIQAVEFFAYLINEVKAMIDQLKKINIQVETLTFELNEDLQKILTARKRIKSFIYELDINSIVKQTEINANPDDFLAWLKSDKNLTVFGFSSLRTNEIKDLLIEYAMSQKLISDLDKKTIEDVLEMLQPKERDQIIRDLDSMAIPLWNYNKGFVGGDNKTDELFIFGVPNGEQSILKENELKQNLRSVQEPSIISTGDPTRIICYKFEAAVPAFILHDFSTYKDRYVNKREANLSHHIHKEWDKLPDLFPGTQEEGRQWWSLANADPFNYVKRKGHFYRVQSERTGSRIDDYWVDLISGRREAMKKFLEDEELVNEIRSKVDQKTDQLGTEKTVEMLAVYMDDLRKMAKRSTPDIKKQIEDELEDIDNYIFNLTNII